ncbi:MAG TPA: IPT/TIG domain-containing protein [Kofleriaceae bacterium]|jgi:hypothetical protein
MTRALRVLAAIVAVVSCSNDNHSSAPTIATVAPATGPATGGTTVTMTGTGLAAGAIVIVGSSEASAVQATGDTQLTFTLPPGTQQDTVDVTVADENGFATSPGSFTYNPIPAAIAITPAAGPAAGGTTVTVTGRGFMSFNAGASTVTIGGVPLTNVQVVSDQMLTGVTGAAPAGAPVFTQVDVQVSNANGSATLPASFEMTKQGLLLISSSDQALVFFDPSTGETVPLSIVGLRLHGCVLGPDGTVYAVARDPSGMFALYTLDPLTGNTTRIGYTTDATNAQYGISSIAFAGNTLYGFVDGPCCSNTFKRLASLDTNTGSATLIGSAAITTTRGESIGAHDATTVYYAETTSGTLDTLSLATSARTTGPTMSGGLGARVHGFVQLGTTLVLLEGGTPSAIYSVNTTTGVLTPMGSSILQGTGVCSTPPSF